ncbi:MAG: hypothetical protein ACYCXA_12730 [Actinomycetes bacterium]
MRDHTQHDAPEGPADPTPATSAAVTEDYACRTVMIQAGGHRVGPVLLDQEGLLEAAVIALLSGTAGTGA